MTTTQGQIILQYDALEPHSYLLLQALLLNQLGPPPSSVEIFKHGIKWDPALFTTFKDGKQFDSWQCSTLAWARAQDVADILDPNYVPSTPADKDLFS